MLSATQPQPYDVPKGRIRRGIWLTRKAITLLDGDRRAWAVPALSAASYVGAAVLLFAPPAVFFSEQTAPFLAACVLAGVAFVFISTFFGVAFLAMVNGHIEGRQMGIADALRFAWSRRAPILGWALLSNAVGWAFRLLEIIEGGEFLGRLIRLLGGLAWSLATFFMLPVLALEDRGPIAGVKRSVSIFRDRWGEQLTGEVAIGTGTGLLVLPAFLTLVAGICLVVVGHEVVGLGLTFMGLAGTATLLVAAGAIARVFSLVLYRYATGRPIPTPFTEADLRDTFRT